MNIEITLDQAKLAKIKLQNDIIELLSRFSAVNGIVVDDLRLSVYSARYIDESKPRSYYDVEVRVNL